MVARNELLGGCLEEEDAALSLRRHGDGVGDGMMNYILVMDCTSDEESSSRSLVLLD